jgi:hypothetical protein
MGGHSPGEPNQTGLGPDGMVPPWQPVPPGNQQPMPPCYRCGAAFAAHLDGRCPQTGASAGSVTAQPWAAGIPGTTQPYAYWVPPLGGPPPVPQLAGSEPRNWPRRHPLVTGAIMLIVLLVSAGIVHEVSRAAGQTTSRTTSQAANGNAAACSDYWNMANAGDAYDVGGMGGAWQDLRAAAPGITDPALFTAVQAFDADLSTGDTVDAGTESFTIGTTCTALGYVNPGTAVGYGLPG